MTFYNVWVIVEKYNEELDEYSDEETEKITICSELDEANGVLNSIIDTYKDYETCQNGKPIKNTPENTQ